VPGGFATTSQPDLRVIGGDLVLPDGRVPINGRTGADLADAAGVDVGEPKNLYRDGSHVDAHEVLEINDDAAEELARAYAVGDEALRRLSPAETPVLWPEHFDIAIRVSGINYGVSPGDSYLGVPYAYVSPDSRGQETFWNAPFGAARPVTDLEDASAMIDFFVEGRILAHGS
jgi:hypothetical protein